MESINSVSSFLSDFWNSITTFQFVNNGIFRGILVFALIAFLAGIVGKLFFGTGSNLSKSVSAAIGIVFIYVVTYVLLGSSIHADIFLAPLPFVSFFGDYLTIFSFSTAEFSLICSELLRMIILAFIVNLIETVMPKPRNLILWYLVKCVTVILGIIIQGIVSYLLAMFLPELILTWAPVVLFVLLALSFLLGAFKALVGVALAIVNPIICAIYAFFFANHIGKMLTRAITTTVIISVLVYVLELFNITAIAWTAAVLTAFVPMIIVLIAIWYIVSHVL